VADVGVTYPIWTDAPGAGDDFDDTNELLSRFGGVGLPTTVFIRSDGIIEHIHMGELNRAIIREWVPGLRK